MQTFLEYTFADFNQPGQWTKLPTNALQKAQRQPAPNIDTELFHLLDKSYAYIGGHIDFQKPSDLPANHTIWYAVDTDRDDIPNAMKFGKATAYGTKWTGLASDGSQEAKQELMKNMVRSLNTPGNFVESSDAIAHVLIARYGVPCVDSHAEVEKVIGKKVTWIGAHPDGKYPGYTGFYERALAGSPHLKILLGVPR